MAGNPLKWGWNIHDIIFTIVTISLLGITLAMAYIAQNGFSFSIYLFTLAMLSAVYLFQFGPLGKFTLEGFGLKTHMVRIEKAALLLGGDGDVLTSWLTAGQKPETEEERVDLMVQWMGDDAEYDAYSLAAHPSRAQERSEFLNYLREKKYLE